MRTPASAPTSQMAAEHFRRQMESTRVQGDEASRVPPAEAAAAAGLRETCRAPRPRTASCRELPPARGY
eukprot:3086015-Prymnesium_polylepis.1